MGKYRKKPIVIEAWQWFSIGDHEKVAIDPIPPKYKSDPCSVCSNPMGSHGSIDTLEGKHIVCPGDWIIKGIKGEYYPCKPDIFEATYKAVE